VDANLKKSFQKMHRYPVWRAGRIAQNWQVRQHHQSEVTNISAVNRSLTPSTTRFGPPSEWQQCILCEAELMRWSDALTRSGICGPNS